MTEKEILSTNLRKIASEKGITQADIARALDVSTASVAYWFTGKTYPKPDSLKKIAEVLDVSTFVLTNTREEQQKKISEFKNMYIHLESSNYFHKCILSTDFLFTSVILYRFYQDKEIDDFIKELSIEGEVNKYTLKTYLKAIISGGAYLDENILFSIKKVVTNNTDYLLKDVDITVLGEEYIYDSFLKFYGFNQKFLASSIYYFESLYKTLQASGEHKVQEEYTSEDKTELEHFQKISDYYVDIFDKNIDSLYFDNAYYQILLEFDLDPLKPLWIVSLIGLSSIGKSNSIEKRSLMLDEYGSK